MMVPSSSSGHEPESLAAWLRSRTPAVPESFLDELLPKTPGLRGGAERLMEEGLAALADALAAPGRDRGAAFRLLAADALLTYACEATVEEEQPGEMLERLLRVVGERFR